MKFRLIKYLMLLTIAIALSYCASGDKKEGDQSNTPPQTQNNPPPAKDEDSSKDPKMKNKRAMDMDEDPAAVFNEKLKEFRYPDGKSDPGFGYKGSDVKKGHFDKWAKENAAYIKEALGKVPDGFALEITGHADSTGPENTEGKKKGNIYYSEKRAEAIKKALVKYGIPAKKIVTKGAGSSSPIPGIDGSDAKNRRVTFQIIKQEVKEEESKQKAEAPKKDEPKADPAKSDDKKEEPKADPAKSDDKKDEPKTDPAKSDDKKDDGSKQNNANPPSSDAPKNQ